MLGRLGNWFAKWYRPKPLGDRWVDDECIEMQRRIDNEYYNLDDPPPSNPCLEKLGLHWHVGGLQTSVGYYAMKIATSPAATAILELLKNALNERGISVDFNQIQRGVIGKTTYERDPYALALSAGDYEIRISTRIDSESIGRECCGFVPEEANGGFGILIFVKAKDDPKILGYYFKEVACAEHYAHPDFNPEVAVDEIHQMTKFLSHSRSLS